MKKQIAVFFLILFTAITLICAGAAGDENETASFGEFSGNGTVNAELAGLSGTPFVFFEKPLYAMSTLPDGLVTFNAFDYVFLCPPGKRSDIQVPDAGELTFLSGDESLKDALCFSLADRVSLGTRSAETARPGEAMFRLRLQAGKLYYEAEVVFRMLSWNEYPLFEFRNPDRSGTAEKGEGPELTDSFGNVAEFYRSPGNNTHLYTKAQIAALLISDHSAEVMGRLLTDEQIQAADEYKSGESLYEISADRDDSGTDYYPQENLWHGVNINTDEECFQFREEGEYRFSLYAQVSNVYGSRQFTVRVLPYKLTGPSTLMPGESGIFAVRDNKPETGRTFTLSAEGEGITFDPETGTLTAAENTPEGTEYTVRAVPSDGGASVAVTGKVTTGLITGETFRTDRMTEGFSVPVPADEGKYTVNRQDDMYLFVESRDDSLPAYLFIDYRIYNPLDEFAEDEETAKKMYSNSHHDSYEEYQDEIIRLGEHIAEGQTLKASSGSGDFSYGELLYARNNRILQIRVFSEPQNGTSWEDLPKVTMGDLRKLAEMIEYDPAQASITAADGAITLAAKEGTDVLTAGKKLTMQAVFASPDKVSKKAKNDTVVWSVADPETGKEPEGVTINDKGVLNAGKQVATVLKVEVKASSPIFHTSAVFPVTIIPAAKSIVPEPSEIFFYTGTDSDVTVKAKIDPDTVPPIGITWTPAKKGIVEIEPDTENGTAVIRPLAAGKTTIQVKEPGGKNGKLAVSVTAPVESIELAVSGKAVPGGTVTVKETLSPKQAGNKYVEWSLDVGEDVATVSKGRVKIAKTVPAGTVITVTCTALGAPEPVVSTIRIEVAEK
ncbi:MAG: hypothetical protein IKE15_06380 [Clostridia bacterium]|nr:hypothetical protein [Clostridia bacterium]